jgi:pilus assembly protein TadC
MLESLITMVLRSLLGGPLGGYLGYRTALKAVALTERPPRGFLTAMLAASVIGGTVLMFIALVVLALVAPGAPVDNLQFIMTIVFAAGVGLNLTNWRLRKDRTGQRPPGG